MAKTPDGRQMYTCPTCKGSGYVMQPRHRRNPEGSDEEKVYCNTCDGSGTIVGEPT